MTTTAPPRPHSVIDIALRLALIAGLIFVCVRIIAPFASILTWSVLLAVMLEPLHRWLCGKGLSVSRAATVIGVGGVLLLAVPEALVGGSILMAASDAVAVETADKIHVPPPPPGLAELPVVGNRAAALWAQAESDLPGLLEKHAPTVKAAIRSFVKQAGAIATSLLLFLFAVGIAGVLLAFKVKLAERAQAIFARVSGDAARGDRLLNLSVSTVRSVLQGVVGVAFIQAVLLGIGFFAAGVPFAGVLVLVAILLGILQIPGIVVALPAIAWAWAHLDSTPAVIFTVWTLVAGLSDNVLKPLMLGRGAEVPMPVIFVGVIGGMLADGLVGLFVGPVLLAVGYVLFNDWLSQPQSA
jgi:predicted PurR-regulated permease PerM